MKFSLVLFLCNLLCFAYAQTPQPCTLPIYLPSSQSSSLPIQGRSQNHIILGTNEASEWVDTTSRILRERSAKRRALFGALLLPVGAASSLLLFSLSEKHQLYGIATPVLAPAISLGLLTSSYALPSMGELLYGKAGKKRLAKYTAARLGVFSLAMVLRAGITSQLRGTEQEAFVPTIQASFLALSLLGNLSITRYEYKTLPR